MKRIVISLLLVVTMVMPAYADDKDLEARIEALEKRVEVLEKLLSVQTEADNGDTDSSDDGRVFYIYNQSGTSEDGNIPVIYADKKTIMTSIAIRTRDFTGSLLTYIYIDDNLYDTKQLSDSQMTLMLDQTYLAEGLHTVTVKQYEENDEDGKVLYENSASYEVKPK